MLAENLDIKQLLFFILLYVALEIFVKGYFIKSYLKIILKIVKNSVLEVDFLNSDYLILFPYSFL